MQNAWSINPYLRASLWFAFLTAAWLVIAPIQMGGRMIFVIVTGSSMVPSMHNGDLAVLRQNDEFQIGDVVLYHHPKLGPVIHRIIAREGSQFVLQGDNNGWKDLSAHRP